MSNASVVADFPQSEKTAASAAADSGLSRASRDQTRYKKSFDLVSALKTANTQTGKRYGEMVKEIFRLGRGNGKLSPRDYFYYRLYDDKRLDWAAKTRFVSEDIHAGVIAKCCDRSWWAVADDKLLAYEHLQAAGLAVPETQAVYDRSGRGFGKLRHLITAEDIANFLRRDARFPLFAKPLGGVASFGALRILGFSEGMLTVDGGETMAFDQLVRDAGNEGYLFQTMLRPHPALATATDAVSTVRVMVRIGVDGPRIMRTVWKIPGKGAIADNFWRPGNLLAAVDAETGEVKRVIRGTGAETEEVAAHPDSNVTLLGMVLPDWERLTDMAREGARLFHPLRYQSWDIAMGEEGPVAVEVNTGSAFNLAQLAWDEGILDEDFARFLRGCGYKLKN